MSSSESEARGGYRIADLGELPEEWEAKELREVVSESFSGGTPSTREASYWDGQIPWITTRSLPEGATEIAGTERHITEEGLRASSSQMAPVDAVLVGTRVGVGKTAVVRHPIAVNQDVTILLPNPNVFSDYLAWAMRAKSMQQVIHDRKRGVTIKGITRADLLSIATPVPPLSEQKKIVAVLQTVQQAKERTEAVIQAARELKKSLLQYLFTYGAVPVDQAEEIELKETEIGEIPTGWDVLAMEEALRESVKNGAFVKRERFGGGSPFLNVADTYHRVRVDIRGLERVQATDDELRTYEVQPRDLFYVRSSLKRQGVGQCCMVYNLPESTVFDCHLMRVRVDEDAFIPEFVAYYSISPRGRSELIARSKTTTMTTINQSGLGAFRIPCPPRQVQCQIAELLQSTQRKIEAEQDHKRALEELFNTLLNDLMTAQIRVDDIELGEVDHDAVGR